MCPQNRVTMIFVLLVVLQVAYASWWNLGGEAISEDVISTSDSKCLISPYLRASQKELCNMDINTLNVISDGESMGRKECQHQFSGRRWNCSSDNTTSVLGIKSRETAYVHAISSAGITYAITKACAEGELENCRCDSDVAHWQPAKDFKWGGCSDNIGLGSRFSRELLDSAESNKSDKGSMNLWNNEAGRMTIKDETNLNCKCHGVSSDCSIKICWKKVQSFRKVGASLKEKFDGASYVRWDQNGQQLKRISGLHKKLTKRDLVYLKESPDFCKYEPENGSFGTRGRECSKTSKGLDGCDSMCCGRGYQTVVQRKLDRCNCKMVWCCEVKCQMCEMEVEKNICL